MFRRGVHSGQIDASPRHVGSPAELVKGANPGVVRLRSTPTPRGQRPPFTKNDTGGKFGAWDRVGLLLAEWASASRRLTVRSSPVSLRPGPVPPIPDETARVARAAFPGGNLHMRMR